MWNGIADSGIVAVDSDNGSCGLEEGGRHT